MANFILIDAGYYCFYRYFATQTWYNFKTKNSDSAETPAKPSENPEFIEKYKKIFIEKMQEIPKKLKITDPIIMVGKDCPQSDIWRNELFQKYKKNRTNENDVGAFFKMVYREKLFEKAGASIVMSHPHLEADDCIAITVKNILAKHPDSKITIITSDMDYLQLANSNVSLYNLAFKPLNTSKNSCGNPEKDLFCKIVAGDKSDNIPSVFPRCGKKTAEKYFENQDLFEKKLQESEEAQAIYKRNRTIIDFNCIPQQLVEEFESETLKK
tara:strand:- start:525 stop:1331 length:807 start_codon:yes stop_codon:yes gene_type:complete